MSKHHKSCNINRQIKQTSQGQSSQIDGRWWPTLTVHVISRNISSRAKGGTETYLFYIPENTILRFVETFNLRLW